jgi:F-type H+-transporting ATPase subunit b
MEALGLNPILLVAQLISFGILFFVLKKFLYSKLRKSLEDRRENIRQITVRNTEVEKKLEDIESQKNEMQKKNQIELQNLILETQKNAEQIKKEILEQAENKSKKMVDEASEHIKQEKLNASDELKAEAKKLAKEIAAKILSKPNNSKKTVDDSIEELEKITEKIEK